MVVGTIREYESSFPLEDDADPLGSPAHTTPTTTPNDDHVSTYR